MYKQKRRIRSGFSLIELLLYLVIVSVIVSVLSAFLVFLMQSREKAYTITEVEEQGILVSKLIAREIRNAQSINTPTIGVSGSTLSLQTYSGATSPTVFDVSADMVRIKEGASTAVPITNSHVMVSGFTVKNLSHAGTKGSVRVSFTLTYNNPSNRQEFSYSETFTVGGALR